MRFFRNTMICLIIFFVVAIVSFCGFYYYSISPVSSNSKNIAVTIPSGTSRDQIATILKEKELIRSELAFRIYLKLNSIDNLQAGSYNFKKSMSTKTIVNKITNGEIATSTHLITFKEGKTIKDLAALIANKSDYNEQDFLTLMKDKTYISELIPQYWFLTSDILNKNIYYPLEGYLFPDTYDIFNLTLKQIVTVQLNNTKKILDKYKTEIEASKYNIHDLMTMASIVELEGTTEADRAKVANVFFNRLKVGIALGSDVTAYYAAGKSLTEEITQAELNSDSPYNTRNVNLAGLPVGPICNPGESAIIATLHPTTGSYLYFMADKNGKIYLSKTLAEQTAKIKELKADGLWFTYD